MMEEEHGSQPRDATELASGTPPAKQRPQLSTPMARGIRLAARVIWIVFVLGCLLGIVLLRVQAGANDYATANVLTVVLGFLAVMALVGRWLLRGDLHWTARSLPLVAIVLAAVASALLLRVDRVSGRLVPRLALRWSSKPDQLLKTPEITEGENPVDVSTTTPSDFPQFLGPQRNLIVTGIELDRDWAAHPPRLLWRQPIGAGWSGFSAVNGFAMTLEQRGDQELVTCYEVATGKPGWVHGVTARHETIMGGVGSAEHANDRRRAGLRAGCHGHAAVPGWAVRHIALARRYFAALRCHA